METLTVYVKEADPESIAIVREARVSVGDFVRGGYRNPVEEFPSYVVVRRQVDVYSWEELEAEVRTSDRDRSRQLSALLAEARRRVPNRQPRTTIEDSEGRMRGASLVHVSRAPLSEAKQWERVASVRVDRAADGTWCALIDVQDTSDFGITHECATVAELARKLSQALQWAYQQKHPEAPAPKKRAPRKPRLVPKNSEGDGSE